jgi:hypothetical protein
MPKTKLRLQAATATRKKIDDNLCISRSASVLEKAILAALADSM